MRGFLLRCSLVLLPTYVFAQACQINWPDPDIPVPPLVRSFISDECLAFDRERDGDWQSCIRSEEYGYRAVVMMLSDAQIGQTAAERYRACRQGLGAADGRFHRRRAECMGWSFGYVWRFEYTRRPSLDGPSSPFDFAGLKPANTRPGF